MKKRIAIFGLGQIGGSIVLSLRKRRAPYSITGFDVSRKRIRLLSSYLDDAMLHAVKTIRADLVILSVHYSQIMEYLKGAPGNLAILDVCSGKQKIVQYADRRKLRFIGGHPMAGNQSVGEKGWDENLFQDTAFFICPGSYALKSDLQLVQTVVRSLGAKPVQVSPRRHDQFVARTSHFPALISRLLLESAVGVPPVFHGPGFHSMTRLASTSPELMSSFLQSNSDQICRCVVAFRDKLNDWLVSHVSQQPRSGDGKS